MIRHYLRLIQFQLSYSWSRPLFRLCLIYSPIQYAVLTYLVYQRLPNADIIKYSLIGSLLASFWDAMCFSSVGDINRERRNRTLEIAYCSPCSFKTIIQAKILANSFFSIISIMIILVIFNLFFQITFEIPNILMFITAVIISFISLYFVALFFASLFSISRKITIYMNIISYPIFILSGFVFPTEILPFPLNIVSSFLLTTWIAKLIRFSISDSNISQFVFLCFVNIVLSVVYYIFYRVFIQRILELIKEGSF